jgi:hypothetical protein
MRIPEFPGVSVAWFKNPSGQLSPPWAGITEEHVPVALRLEVRTFLDAALYESNVPAVPRVYNESIIELLLYQDIIVEQSPPEAVPLMNVIMHGTNISIGSYLGYAISGGDIPLMFITVPAGVIVMGAAIGISNGLKNGLQKTIEGVFAATNSLRTPSPTARRGRKR